jgi:hypothetical protein
MTQATKIQLTLNEIRAGRGQYASLSSVERCLLVNDILAGRVTV